MTKTNALRILDAEKIGYKVREYDPEITDGEQVALTVNVPPTALSKRSLRKGTTFRFTCSSYL